MAMTIIPTKTTVSGADTLRRLNAWKNDTARFVVNCGLCLTTLTAGVFSLTDPSGPEAPATMLKHAADSCRYGFAAASPDVRNHVAKEGDAIIAGLADAAYHVSGCALTPGLYLASKLNPA
jgi:hypothetical protein